MNIKELQAIVKENVTIFEEGNLFIASHNENDDEFELTRSNDLADLYEKLKGMQQVK